MNTNNIEMFIYVKAENQQDNRLDVIDIVNKISGIAAARVHPWMNRLVEISYNPQTVNSINIINAIRKKGWHSALVGM